MSNRMWEVDPETRSKLLAIQKQDGNDRCCDCGAPSPQWATPKFGIFICLNCAGIHRGLGVHISFVRSITMDGFKGHEIARMTMSGGNDAWKRFYDQHEVNKKVGRRFETASTKERYVGVVGEEWKERLACKVEGRTYVPGERKADTATNTLKTTSSSPSAAPSSIPTQSPQSARKAANEAYFARMGAANAQRPDSLPPSQGGKYAGFGGGMPVEEATGAGASARGSRSGAAGGGGIPALDDFQQDPVAALTKGFGWFTSTIGKGARQVHEGWVQPAAKTIASSDFAAQARAAAQQGFQNFQTGARSAGSQFNRFVEGGAGAAGGEAGMYSPSAHEQTQAQTQSQSQSQARSQAISSPSTARRRNDQPPPENQDFWDDFASAAEQRRNILGAQSVGLANANASASPAGKARTSTDGGAGASSTTVGGGGSGGAGSIGTAAMRNRGGAGAGAGAASGAGTGGAGKDDGWDDDW